MRQIWRIPVQLPNGGLLGGQPVRMICTTYCSDLVCGSGSVMMWIKSALERRIFQGIRAISHLCVLVPFPPRLYPTILGVY